jgi:predicted transposase YbfD/YdcC
LDLLSLRGAIVTTDARNCQRDIARQIVEQGGDYALALKGNQRALHADVSQLLEDPRYDGADRHSTADSNRGRIETRTSLVCTDIEALQKRHRWPGRVIRMRNTTTKATTKTAYYLLSKALSPERLAKVVRSHWGVENHLHWALNVVMNEDQSRSCNEKAAYNLAILRHIALNLMQKDRSKISLRSKFNLAGWKEEFLAKLLAPNLQRLRLRIS